MKTIIEHGIVLAIRSSRGRSIQANATAIANRALIPRPSAWTCHNCLAKSELLSSGLHTLSGSKIRPFRMFATSSRFMEEGKRPPHASSSSPEPHGDPHDVNTVPKAADSKTLPSQTEEQRWQFSKRMARVMDQLLARASLASQRINVYTGTDYSGIEALRHEIIALEQQVRVYHQGVEQSRLHHRDAHSKQASSQKEIVGLLERKSSWSPSDLERYMSLVRSEHTDEQAVNQAKEDLAQAERTLEDSRSLLERLERKQYHEEQIWSDTIRRNSTWVTFGLMGVNIVLLLAQIAVFEPYRRRKIVKDVQMALDEKMLHAPNASLLQAIDEAIEPVDASFEQVERVDIEAQSAQAKAVSVDAKADLEVAQPVLNDNIPETSPMHARTDQHAQSTTWWTERWYAYRSGIEDLFSDHIIQITKVEATTIALNGAAAGAVLTGLAFALFRSIWAFQVQ